MVRWSARGALLAGLLALGACGGDGSGGGSGTGDGKACDPACAEGERCVDGVCVGPPDGDGDGVADEADACPETPAGAEVNRQGCNWQEVPIPFSSGPYGTGIRDLAGDFTVQTLDGTFRFSERWAGNESFLFLLRHAASSYSLGLFSSDFAALLAESPRNVHYLFLDSSAEEATRRDQLEAVRARFEEVLATLPEEDAAHWRTHLHFVIDPVEELDGALGEFFRAHRSHAFAVDRFQRWREVGLLVELTTERPEIRFLGREAAGFEYERRLAWEVESLDALAVTVFDGHRHPGGWADGYASTVEVEFPDAATLARYDSMAVQLYTACPGHLQGLEAGCNEWDYAHHLWLCDRDDPTRCETELVRYVTPYGREGEWLTDISPLLPLLADGGRRTLRYTGANGYELHLRFLFWDAGKTLRPVEATFLFGSSDPIQWVAGYNESFEPIRFDLEAIPPRMELFSVVTGHGFDATLDRCAEFCNSEHEFVLNGTSWVEDHPEADDRLGCYRRVEQGVVPNQFGTWPFGRAGWCPGQDVKPWVQDVTDALVVGTNELLYRAWFRGRDYSPIVTNPGGYRPEFRLQTWLVRYEAK